jgi:microcystin-dependent protein
MSNPFVAEIRIFTGNFAPKGWALCDGQLMSISQNTALFSNLQGCAPMQQGQGPGLSLRDLGETSGVATVTLLDSQMPSHSHGVKAASSGGLPTPVGNAWGSGLKTAAPLYAAPPAPVQMSGQSLTITGGSQPHNNMPPYLVLTFIIALQGVFPPRT